MKDHWPKASDEEDRSNLSRPLLIPQNTEKINMPSSKNDDNDDSSFDEQSFVVRRKQNLPDGEDDSRSQVSDDPPFGQGGSFNDNINNGPEAFRGGGGRRRSSDHSIDPEDCSVDPDGTNSLAELSYGGSGVDLHPHHKRRTNGNNHGGGNGQKRASSSDNRRSSNDRHNRSSSDRNNDHHSKNNKQGGAYNSSSDRESSRAAQQNNRRSKPQTYYSDDDLFGDDAGILSDKSNKSSSARQRYKSRNSSRHNRNGSNSSGRNGKDYHTNGLVSIITRFFINLPYIGQYAPSVIQFFDGVNMKTVILCIVGMSIVMKLNTPSHSHTHHDVQPAPATMGGYNAANGGGMMGETLESVNDVYRNGNEDGGEGGGEGGGTPGVRGAALADNGGGDTQQYAPAAVIPPPPADASAVSQQTGGYAVGQTSTHSQADAAPDGSVEGAQPSSSTQEAVPDATTGDAATATGGEGQQQQQLSPLEFQQQQQAAQAEGQLTAAAAVADGSGTTAEGTAAFGSAVDSSQMAPPPDGVAVPPAADATTAEQPAADAATESGVPLVPAPAPPGEVNPVSGSVVGLLSNFQDAWNPWEQTDIPMFWHIPKAGGSSIKDAMGGCHRFVQATEFGITDGHDADTEVAIVYPAIPGVADTDRSPFVNIDSTTPGGITRANSMGFADAQLAQVVVSPFVFETNDLFTQTAKGRLFSVFRHPIERAVSMFYYIRVADWEPSYSPEMKEWSIEQYATSDKIENVSCCGDGNIYGMLLYVISPHDLCIFLVIFMPLFLHRIG